MNKTRFYLKKLIAITLIVSIYSTSVIIFPKVIKADSQVRTNYEVYVDGQDKGHIMAMELNYDNDVYISLKGIANALNGTNGAFSPAVTDSEIRIEKGINYSKDPSLWEDEEFNERGKLKVQRHDIFINGEERKYYSMIGNIGDGEKDAFLRPITLAMILDVHIEVDDKFINVDTSLPLLISSEDILKSGMTEGVNGLLIGNGSTGEVYLADGEDVALPIASTTKIMTYYLVMDAVKDGQISLDDMVYISEAPVYMSESIDGVIAMSEGMRVPVKELIMGMLLKSSNECAIALAEHVAGSEAAFVELMNKKAKELNLNEAAFYNCNGVPVFDDQLMPAKMQNHMTAREMFELASNVLREYPEMLDITSTKTAKLDNLHTEVNNTNAALYNVKEVKGLKTGTTNKSGACIVTAMPLEKNGETHNLITVIFGTEGELDRSTYAEITARYAIERFRYDNGEIVEIEEPDIINDKNKVADKLVECFMKRHIDENGNVVNM